MYEYSLQQELQPFQSRRETYFLKDQLHLVFHCIKEGIDENTLQTQL